MNHLKDRQQITFVRLNGFCPLSKTPSPLPVLSGQYQPGWNTTQNQIKHVHLFDILFQVLKVVLIKKYQIPANSSFISCCYTSAFTSGEIILLQLFRTSFNTI